MKVFDSFYFSNKVVQGKKLYILLLLVVLLFSACSKKYENLTQYDFETYLQDDSAFFQNVSLVMPSRDFLENQNIILYSYYDNGLASETRECKIIHMIVEYAEEDFITELQNIEDILSGERYPNMFQAHKAFYINDKLYRGFIFYEQWYCAVAYHVSEETRTISYIAFDTFELQFMDIELALGYCPPYEYEK